MLKLNLVIFSLVMSIVTIAQNPDEVIDVFLRY
jgi:hypothetical protein